MFINWNIVPFNFNNNYPNLLWTVPEWLGKLAYVADDHERRIETVELKVEVLENTVSAFNTRIETLENYKTNTLEPFFNETLETLATYSYINNYFYNRNHIDNEFTKQLNLIADNSRQIESLRNEIKTDSKATYYSYSVPTPQTTGGHNVYTIDKKADYTAVNLSIVFADHFVLNIFVPTSPGSSRSAINLNNSIINISVADDSIMISVDNTTITSIDSVYYKGEVIPTPEEKEILFTRADINGDNTINTIDASAILSYALSDYPKSETGWIEYYNSVYGTDPSGLMPDLNGDGTVDSRDASLALTFYTKCNSGEYENNADGFYNYINGVI